MGQLLPPILTRVPRETSLETAALPGRCPAKADLTAGRPDPERPEPSKGLGPVWNSNNARAEFWRRGGYLLYWRQCSQQSWLWHAKVHRTGSGLRPHNTSQLDSVLRVKYRAESSKQTPGAQKSPAEPQPCPCRQIMQRSAAGAGWRRHDPGTGPSRATVRQQGTRSAWARWEVSLALRARTPRQPARGPVHRYSVIGFQIVQPL